MADSKETQFRRVEEADLKSVIELLQINSLPTDLGTSDVIAFVATENDTVIGHAAVEVWAPSGLLRSVVTHPDKRNSGIASQLVTLVEENAVAAGINTMFLLTETAEGYFARRGYNALERNDAPPEIQATSEFAELCPASAILMSRTLRVPVSDSGGEARIIEFKARCRDKDRVRKAIQSMDHDFVGVDQQTDTYYKVASGRLKLRTGPIENTLIYYNRADDLQPKQSDVHLFKPHETESLKALLGAALAEDVVVSKSREIYFVDNVKIHIDEVSGLGSFVEVEAIDSDGSIAVETLKEQCMSFLEAFGISDGDLVAVSYSDLLRDHQDT